MPSSCHQTGSHCHVECEEPLLSAFVNLADTGPWMRVYWQDISSVLASNTIAGASATMLRQHDKNDAHVVLSIALGAAAKGENIDSEMA